MKKIAFLSAVFGCMLLSPSIVASENAIQNSHTIVAVNPFSALFGRDNNQERQNYRNSRDNARSYDRNRSYRYQTQRNYQHNNYRYNRQRQHYREVPPRYQNSYHYQNQNRQWGRDDGYREHQTQRYQYQQDRYSYEPKRPNSTVRFSTKICESGDYKCIKVKPGQSWKKLFPNAKQRDLVKRFNRTNMRLSAGQEIAIPKDLEDATLLDISPFSKQMKTRGEKTILVDLSKQAFGAYDADGDLVHWGPVSGGQNWCSDIQSSCNTIRGIFNVFTKKDARCRSRSFPVDRGGGAPMPYCMFFHSGYALHGSHEVPGYNASHGCVRMYTEDAKWLNEQFIELPEGEHDKGTRIIVLTNNHDIQDSQQATYVDSDEDEDWDSAEDYYDL